MAKKIVGFVKLQVPAGKRQGHLPAQGGGVQHHGSGCEGRRGGVLGCGRRGCNSLSVQEQYRTLGRPTGNRYCKAFTRLVRSRSGGLSKTVGSSRLMADALIRNAHPSGASSSGEVCGPAQMAVPKRGFSGRSGLRIGLPRNSTRSPCGNGGRRPGPFAAPRARAGGVGLEPPYLEQDRGSQ